MRRYFTNAFNASWAKAMSHDEDVLDGDPITGLQQVVKVQFLSATSSQPTPMSAKFIAKLKVAVGGKTEPEQVIFELKLEGRQWKIDDITSGSVQPIRSYLGKSYGA